MNTLLVAERWANTYSAAWDATRLVEHLGGMLHGVEAATFTCDAQTDLYYVSERLADMLGLHADVTPFCKDANDLFRLSELFDESALAQMHEALHAAIASADIVSPKMAVTGACLARVFSLQIRRIDAAIWLVTCEDVTDKQAAERRAIELSMLDPLTGLANRQLFSARASAAIMVANETAPAWMMLVDLDRFKAVNDTLGHPIGDSLLKLVAKRLRSTGRENDVVARLGGDEFALILSDTIEIDGVEKLARRLIDVLGRPYLIDGHVVHIGASVGIAAAPNDAHDPDQLTRNADLAMYASKKAGRNTFSFFDASMDAKVLARRTMEIDLRKAIALRQFELHFQPQIDLDRNAIVGFEALLRWRHPTRGLVLPGEFIPLAEEIGLIVPIGEWVVRAACAEAIRWPDPMTVAVNVSPYQFEQTAALVSAVERALKASGLPGYRLEIEITEGVLLRNEKAVLAALHQFRAMGVLIAMDDFGTGYSSLSQLNSFPFNKIKIDQSFVNGVGDNANSNAIIRAISALGLSLGMATIAEGVETSDELARIRSNGCTSVQGYLFSKPLPIEQIASLIATFADKSAIPHIQAA